MGRQASQKVLDIVEPVVSGLGYEFVGAEYLPQGKHSLLRVYIDHPENGISLDDCEAVSRQLSSVLDVEDPISGQYSLEISSPGMDRPLFVAEHYQRFAGQQVKLRLAHVIDGRRNITAKLVGCDGQVVSLDVDGESVEVSLADIERARLVPVFD